ncbi:hypothetical protein MHSN_03420 [Metamycoplasma hyosynoviae]|uniref:Lipoprotein n=1 Tax=Metamycoplasma hyosynoviae TaxID=29559 RepID=A0A4P1QGP7_9BACT|nr:hypothetical protein [Metamycoplasma hyosynoviae]ASI54195.1 hypothetical protein MHSN_03420 [Metamycoplasma hyosynoviae]
MKHTKKIVFSGVLGSLTLFASSVALVSKSCPGKNPEVIEQEQNKYEHIKVQKKVNDQISLAIKANPELEGLFTNKIKEKINKIIEESSKSFFEVAKEFNITKEVEKYYEDFSKKTVEYLSKLNEFNPNQPTEFLPKDFINIYKDIVKLVVNNDTKIKEYLEAEKITKEKVIDVLTDFEAKPTWQITFFLGVQTILNISIEKLAKVYDAQTQKINYDKLVEVIEEIAKEAFTKVKEILNLIVETFIPKEDWDMAKKLFELTYLRIVPKVETLAKLEIEFIKELVNTEWFKKHINQ